MTEVHGRKRVEVTTATIITIVVAVLALLLVGVTNSARAGEAGPDGTGLVDGSTQAPSAPPTTPATGSVSGIKNVVLILADDLDWAAFDQVPRLAALKAQGTTLSNFVVTDSLCCPSRTSLMRSQFVHNHRVLSNVPKSGGGWEKFYARDLEMNCLPTWLNRSGVDTSLIGKYLNGFPTGAPAETYIPPGWNYFVSSTSKNQAYVGWNYTLNENGKLKSYGNKPQHFLNDVLTAAAIAHIASVKVPFFMELATYNPHVPAPVAARHAGTHSTDTIPRTPSFNTPGTGEVNWLSSRPVLTAPRVANLDRLWRKRLQSTESVADSYDAITAQLKATGHADDTLVIVTSDNGYHAGVHRLATGKQTAFREDSVVPAIFIGPGIAKGAVIDETTSMVDLGPTIAELLGASTPEWVDGRSLLPLLSGQADVPWRTATLTESLARTTPGDPDYTPFEPPPFHALRSRQWLYVEYRSGEVELYNLKNDPFEMNNVVSSTNPTIIGQLHAQLDAMVHCTGPTCRIADSMPNGTSILPLPQPTSSPVATASPSDSASGTPSPTAASPAQ
ncbi:MAG: sulfatase [Candidatus Nanopelagicales bacterium]